MAGMSDAMPSQHSPARDAAMAPDDLLRNNDMDEHIAQCPGLNQ